MAHKSCYLFCCFGPKRNSVAPAVVTTDAPVTKETLNALFKEYYHDFRSCHLAHAAIARERLGASLDQTRAVLNHAAKEMEVAGEMNVNTTATGSWLWNLGGTVFFTHVDWNGEEPDALFGSDRGYHTLLRHYRKLLTGTYLGSAKSLIAWEFPKLYQGMAGGVMHGLVHLGYGVSAANDRIICEGLAYLHTSYCPINMENEPELSTLGCGEKGIFDVLRLVRINKTLMQYVKNENNKTFDTFKHMGIFQKRVALLLDNKAGILLDYVHQLQFPDFKPEDKSRDPLQALLKWLVDCSIMIFLASSKPNNFFLLHGITSSWALAEVLPCLSRREDVMAALRVQLCLLLATYLAEEAPELDINLLGNPNVDGLSWEDIKRSTLGLSVEADTHICKVVQICRESSMKNSDANMEKIYKRASMVVGSQPSTSVCPTKFSVLQQTRL